MPHLYGSKFNNMSGIRESMNTVTTTTPASTKPDSSFEQMISELKSKKEASQMTIPAASPSAPHSKKKNNMKWFAAAVILLFVAFAAALTLSQLRNSQENRQQASVGNAA